MAPTPATINPSLPPASLWTVNKYHASYYDYYRNHQKPEDALKHLAELVRHRTAAAETSIAYLQSMRQVIDMLLTYEQGVKAKPHGTLVLHELRQALETAIAATMAKPGIAETSQDGMNRLVSRQIIVCEINARLGPQVIGEDHLRLLRLLGTMGITSATEGISIDVPLATAAFACIAAGSARWTNPTEIQHELKHLQDAMAKLRLAEPNQRQVCDQLSREVSALQGLCALIASYQAMSDRPRAADEVLRGVDWIVREDPAPMESQPAARKLVAIVWAFDLNNPPQHVQQVIRDIAAADQKARIVVIVPYTGLVWSDKRGLERSARLDPAAEREAIKRLLPGLPASVSVGCLGKSEAGEFHVDPTVLPQALVFDESGKLVRPIIGYDSLRKMLLRQTLIDLQPGAKAPAEEPGPTNQIGTPAPADDARRCRPLQRRNQVGSRRLCLRSRWR